MSTVVDLIRFWVNDAVDPSDRLSVLYMPESYDVDGTLGGGVEDGYASGRSRGWSTEDDLTAISIPLVSVSASDVAWFRTHRGRPVCFRDPLGLKVFCQYQDVNVSYSTRGGVHTSDLALSSVTWSEAV